MGARKARALATPFLEELRQAVGLGRLSSGAAVRRAAADAEGEADGGTAARVPVFKQYREADGRFYFKLSAHDGRVLLQSEGFDGGRDAGLWVKRIRAEGVGAAKAAPVSLGPQAQWDLVEAALNRLIAQDALEAQRAHRGDAGSPAAEPR